MRTVQRDRKTAEIAAVLNMNAATVETHLKRARGKLGGIDRFRAAEALRTFEGTTKSLGTQAAGTALGMEDLAALRPSKVPGQPLLDDREVLELNEARVPFQFQASGERKPDGRQLDRNAVMTVILIASALFMLVVAGLSAVALSDSAQRLAKTIFAQR